MTLQRPMKEAHVFILHKITVADCTKSCLPLKLIRLKAIKRVQTLRIIGLITDKQSLTMVGNGLGRTLASAEMDACLWR